MRMSRVLTSAQFLKVYNVICWLVRWPSVLTSAQFLKVYNKLRLKVFIINVLTSAQFLKVYNTPVFDTLTFNGFDKRTVLKSL